MSDTAPILSSGLAALQRDLDALPDGTRGAAIVVADTDGIMVGVATRLGDGSWTLAAEIEQRWARQRPEARISVSKSW